MTLSPERQSALMSKITNDGLTRSGTGCFLYSLYQYGSSGHERVNAANISRDFLLNSNIATDCTADYCLCLFFKRDWMLFSLHSEVCIRWTEL